MNVILTQFGVNDLPLFPLRLRTWRRTSSTSSRFALWTWQAWAKRLCPVPLWSARSGPSPCQVSQNNLYWLLKINLHYIFVNSYISQETQNSTRLVYIIITLCQIYVLSQGAPVGLYVLEVRDTSVVVQWEPPLFDGRSPVNGYYLDIKEASAGEKGWKAVHEKANKGKYMKVSMNRRLLRMLFMHSFCWQSRLSQNNMHSVCIFLTGSPSGSSCADSGEWTEGRLLLRLPRACSKSRRSWKALSTVGSDRGPDSPRWVPLLRNSIQ